jgi:chlorosome envelope protein B
MANETNDFSTAVSAFLDTASKLAQQQVELLTSGVKAVAQVAEPLAKTAIDLVGSASNTVGQVFQSAASAIAPKK